MCDAMPRRPERRQSSSSRPALAMIEHPNILKLLDAGMTGPDARASVLECGSPLCSLYASGFGLICFKGTFRCGVNLLV